MAPDERGGRRRGPPKSSRARSPPSESRSQDGEDEAEWYDDVVDDSQSDGRGFGGFSVKRPTLHSTDQAEGEQLERYFEKQYHGKADEKRASIEEGWDEEAPSFDVKSLFAGHKIMSLGIQSFMNSLPMFIMSFAMVWGGQSAIDSMDGSAGLIVNLILVILAVCLTTIAFIQIVVHSVNQSLRDRSLVTDGPDIPLLGWSGSFQMSTMLFVEMILTFSLVWFMFLVGLYLLVGDIPDLTLPTIDSDEISAGSILYLLGIAGSACAMFGVIPYAIQETIERS